MVSTMDEEAGAHVPLLEEGESQHASEPRTNVKRDKARLALFAAYGFAASLLLAAAFAYVSGSRARQVAAHTFQLLVPLAAVPTVVLAAGNRWSGFRTDDDQLMWYLDIPYADTPTRFRRAVPYSGTTWNETAREPHWYPEGCATPAGGGSEDCLKINVVTPGHSQGVTAKSEPVLLPVLLYIYGGSLVFGSGSEMVPTEVMLQGLEMRKPIIYVSFNYRLASLGFSAAPLDNGGPPRDLDLNVGFKDQLLAMEWVYANIASFGGDPTKVTLFGLSAGAMSIGLHQIYSPPHLFRAAFLMSGTGTSFPVFSPQDATTRILTPLSNSACNSTFSSEAAYSGFIHCLRNVPVWDLIGTSVKALVQTPQPGANFPWYPVLEDEGGWLNMRPTEKFKRGEYSKVPVIVGNTLDESTVMIDFSTNTLGNVSELIRGLYTAAYESFSPLIPALLGIYNNGYAGPTRPGTTDYFSMGAALFGDLVFQAPRRFLLEQGIKHASSMSGKQWSYLFDDLSPWADARYGVIHTADFKSWFGKKNGWPHQEERAKLMVSYLINFVTNLDPNGLDLPLWPAYDSKRNLLHFKVNEVVPRADDYRTKGMSWINEHLAQLGY